MAARGCSNSAATAAGKAGPSASREEASIAVRSRRCYRCRLLHHLQLLEVQCLLRSRWCFRCRLLRHLQLLQVLCLRRSRRCFLISGAGFGLAFTAGSVLAEDEPLITLAFGLVAGVAGLGPELACNSSGAPILDP